MERFRRLLLAGGCAALCAGSVAGAPYDVGDKARVNAAADQNDWLLHGRTYDNQRYSPLTQIDKANVSRLVLFGNIHTGIQNSLEATPIVVNGTMFVVTANDHVRAYNAVTGDKLWAYDPVLAYAEACCGPQARGVAVAYGKVFVAQFDGVLTALDATTGKAVWKTDRNETHPEPRHDYTYTMAPQVYDGMVIVGTAGAEYETRGMVEAYDANTGKKLWEFRTTAAPGQPGGDTWGGTDVWKTGGGSIWNTPSVDTKRDLLVFSTGNPNPDYQGTNRPGDNAYTDSIMALHAKDGTLAWWYQEVPHDMWDYDASAPVMLFDAKDDSGKTVPAAGEAGKVGNVFIVNRLTGKLLRKSDPFVYQSPNIFTAPTREGITLSPGVNGGSLWQPPAFSPRTHDFYVLGANIPMTFTAIDFKDSPPGGPWVGRHTGGVMKRGDGPQSGTLTAIDVDTGKINWQYTSQRPIYGGVLATASDLIFAGEQDGDFDAFDARTGKKLWSHKLGMGICTPSITYRVKGVQYIAVGAAGCRGGHLPNGQPAYGDTIAIFALPDKITR
jgi:PQQ-dependent dehydrogenase (methanol/ethanol family)